MRFFPALTEDFTSLLPPAELLRHVQASVQQAWEFSGRVAGSQFTISRVIDYRNSMLLRISGEVVAGPMGGSRLRLRHQLHPLVRAFGAMWLGIVGSVVGGMGLTLVQGSFRTVGEGSVWPNLIPVGMLVGGLLLFTVPFWAEVRQSRPRLIELLRLAPVAAPQGTPPGADQR